MLLGDEREGWAEVVAPWQPVPGQDGYRGWVRTAHLRQPVVTDPDHPRSHVPADRIALAAYAERFQGLSTSGAAPARRASTARASFTTPTARPASWSPATPPTRRSR